MHTAPRVTVAEAAAIVGCSVWSIYRRIEDGTLTPVERFGKVYVLDRSDVEALAEERAA